MNIDGRFASAQTHIARIRIGKINLCFISRLECFNDIYRLEDILLLKRWRFVGGCFADGIVETSDQCCVVCV